MTLRLIALCSAALLAAPALAADWQIDPAHSQADFKVRHLGISNVTGSLGPVSGTIHLDEKDPSKSTVTASIDVSGIDTREPKRDGHLKSPDFFDVAKFPTVNFVSTKVEKAGMNKLKVMGNLTMHGVTKPVVLEVEGPSEPMKDPFGGTRIAASATTKLDRTDYGLTWNKTLDKGGLLVGTEIEVNLSVEANAAKK